MHCGPIDAAQSTIRWWNEQLAAAHSSHFVTLLMFPPAPLSTSLLSPKHCVTPTKVLDGKFHTNITSSEQQKRALVFFDKIRTCSRVCGVEGVGSVSVAARDHNAWQARTDCSPPTDLRPRAERRPSVRRDSYSSLIFEQKRPIIIFHP